MKFHLYQAELKVLMHEWEFKRRDSLNLQKLNHKFCQVDLVKAVLQNLISLKLS